MFLPPQLHHTSIAFCLRQLFIQPGLLLSLSQLPFPAMLGLSLTLVTLTGSDLDPYLQADILAWPWPGPTEVPDP